MKWMSLLLIPLVLATAVDIHKHKQEVPTEVFPCEDATIISFGNGIVFDTRNGDPELPPHLVTSNDVSCVNYIIQFTGPIYTAWIEDLKSSGIEVMGYIPQYALLVHATPAHIENIAQREYVQWTGVFHPAYKLQQELMDATGQARVTIQLFPDQDISKIANQIEALGFSVYEVIDHPLSKSVDATVDLSRVHEIAHIPGVLWVQKWTPAELHNNNSQWVCQTGWRSSVPSNPGARQVWYNGVIGQGVVLSLTDSGVRTTHYQYYDSAYPISSPGVFPNHRKMVAYKLYQGAVFGDSPIFSYHGTHTDCTAAGNDTTYGTSNRDGNAKLSRIYFVDIGSNSGLVVSTNLTPMYDTVYLGRGLGYHILQHSGSWGWGNYSGTYLYQDATTDAYMYSNSDLCNIFSAGNSGSGSSTIGNPAISKNTITVGGTNSSTGSNNIYTSSSRGPTQDQRIKPSLMAPAVNVYSAYGGSNNGYQALTGTSMAAPAVNGCVALIRQYLLAGYYPTGLANAGDSIKYQSAALLRAMALVSTDPNVGSWQVPSYNIGWGRIDVDSVLYFDGDTRRLIILDDTIGVSTGGSITDSFEVNSSIPLRVCVVWTDTAGASGSNPTLVNDLNVQITAPGGTYYRGNQYTSGQSTANPGSWDNRNVEECCRVNSPAIGIWTITISGQNVPNGPMGFAYAITGDVTQVIPGVAENTSAIVPAFHSSCASLAAHGQVNMSISLPASSQVAVRLLDITGRVVTTLVDEQLPQGVHALERPARTSSGVYFVEVRAGDYHNMHKVLIIQ